MKPLRWSRPSLGNGGDAEREQCRDHHDHVTREHRARHRQHEGQHLREERHRREREPQDDSHRTRPDTGELLRQRRRRRPRAVRDRAHEAAEDVAHPVRCHRALNRAEVDCPATAPGHALDADRGADRADGQDHDHQQEAGQQPPEARAEVEGQARPGEFRRADPSRAQDAVDIVCAERPGHGRAHDDAHDRGPGPELAAALQHDPSHDQHGCQRADRGRVRRRRGRHVVQQSEGDRYHGDRQEQQDRPRHGRREDAAEQRQPRREGKLEHPGGTHQHGQQSRPAGLERVDADGDGGARGAGDQHVTGADAAETERLQGGNPSAHDERRERRPGDQRLRRPRRTEHRHRYYDHAGKGEDRELQPQTRRQHGGGPLVGLVENPRFGFARRHRPPLSLTPAGRGRYYAPCGAPRDPSGARWRPPPAGAGFKRVGIGA